MSASEHDFHPGEVPAKPGVYVFRDRFGKVIYVGKAVNLRRRLSQYFQPSRLNRADAKLRSLINSIDRWEYYTVNNEDEALILESRLIKEYAPHYNILMRDDKRYLLLKLREDERFPTLVPARVRKDDNARYFGPFPKGYAMRQTLEFLLAYFKLRSCRADSPDAETRKHCLKRMVRDCCEPCSGKCSEAEYRERLDRMLEVLAGDIKPLTAELKERMTKLAAAQKFELAARFRDVIENLETVFGSSKRLFATARIPGGGGEEALAELAEALNLPLAPHRIEGFDISNILGTLAVGSLVVAVDGRPAPQEYRRFRVKTVFQSDDFAMMKEVVTRRYRRRIDENLELPDLVLIDGGKGQLKSACEALAGLGLEDLPVVGLAKRNEELFLPGRADPVILSRFSGALRILQALRDEAHRFAVSYHRELRQKRLQQSLLDDIPGVGEVRKRELLKTFGSVRALRKVTAEEIAERVPGLGTAMAEKIHQALRRR